VYGSELAKAYLYNEGPSSFQTVLRLMALASSIALNEMAPSNTQWNDDKSLVCISGIQISLLHVRSGNWGIYKNLEELAAAIARTPNPHGEMVLPSSLHVQKGTGQSILQHRALAPFQGRENPILKRWMKALVSGGNGTTFNRSVLADYFALSSEFWLHLAVMVNLVCGPPPRASDLLDVTIRDAAQHPTLQRGLNKWMLNYSHAKLHVHSHHRWFSLAFVHPALESLFGWAVTVLRSADIVLARAFYGHTRTNETYSKYLFVTHGERLATSALSDTQKRLTKEWYLAPLNIQAHRQFAQAMVNAFIPKHHTPAGMTHSDAGNQAMGHSNPASNLHYARDHDFQALSSEQVHEYNQLCQDYARTVMPGPNNCALLPLTTIVNHTQENLRYRAAIHTATAEGRQAEMMQRAVDQAVQRAVAACAEAALVQQRDLFDRFRAIVVDGMNELSRSGGSMAPGVAHMRDASRDAEALELTRRALQNPCAQFKPGQLEHVRSMMSQFPQHVILAVPCGFGKSLSWLLPASTFQRDKIHLVVLPYVALVEQCMRGAQALRVTCYDWSRDHPPVADITHGIIFFTSESLDEKSLPQ
jgi:hypothetical protein